MVVAPAPEPARGLYFGAGLAGGLQQRAARPCPVRPLRLRGSWFVWVRLHHRSRSAHRQERRASRSHHRPDLIAGVPMSAAHRVSAGTFANHFSVLGDASVLFSLPMNSLRIGHWPMVTAPHRAIFTCAKIQDLFCGESNDKQTSTIERASNARDEPLRLLPPAGWGSLSRFWERQARDL